jgi:hypothetical protein
MLGAVDVVRVAAQSRLFIIITHTHTPSAGSAHTIPLEEKKAFCFTLGFYLLFYFSRFLN